MESAVLLTAETVYDKRLLGFNCACEEKRNVFTWKGVSASQVICRLRKDKGLERLRLEEICCDLSPSVILPLRP